jgi:CRP-like cAMP-binding protein
MSSELKEALKSILGFGALSDAALDQLTPFVSLRAVRAGETVFCQGEPSPYCFGVLEGEVTVQHVSKDRRFPPKVLGVLGPGSLFGESSIFEDSARLAMASASKDGRLVAIRGSQLRAWIGQDPQGGQPLLLALLQAANGRLYRTSHELAVIYGVGRLLGSEKPFLEQMGAALEFIKGSIEGLDDVVFYQRSAYWEEFSPLLSYPLLQDLTPVPLHNELVQKVSMNGAVATFIPRAVQSYLSAFKLPWEERAAMAIIPLFDWDKAQDALQGLLCLASRHGDQAFAVEKHLLLTSLSRPLAEALSRHGRQEESRAQARLQKSKTSFPNP